MRTDIDADVSRARQSLVARDSGLSAAQAMAAQAIQQAGAVKPPLPPAPAPAARQHPGRRTKPQADDGFAAAQAALAADAETVVHAGKLINDSASALLSASVPAPTVGFCDRPRLRPTLVPAGGGEPLVLYDTPEQEGLCRARAAALQQIEAAGSELGAWVHGQWLLGRYLDANRSGLAASTGPADEQLARVFLSVINYNVLPVLLGALAATAAGLRSIGRKVEGNMLLPRDLKFVWVRLTLGAFLGAVIGLFISPSESEGLYTLIGLGAAAPAGTAAGGIALSAPTFSFLAGFATERIFSWLERLIGHIFSFGDPSEKPASRTAVAH